MSQNYPRYSVATDIALFTVQQEQLHVLLIKRGIAPFKGQWALPGGFLKPDEDLEICARRELEDETGARGCYLEQLYTFGTIGRDPRERVISVAYFALVRPDQVELKSGTDAEDARWSPLQGHPRLAFDHDKILATAHERLSAKLDYSTIAFQLLPERFTMREVHAVYQAILGTALDRRNFYKKMLATGDLVETKDRRVEGAHRPATVYRLKKPQEVRITR